jgi:ABC-type transport system involved in multi-copper enzyme maturation permease subunit
MYNLVIKDFHLVGKQWWLLLLWPVFFLFIIKGNPQGLPAAGLYLTMLMLLLSTTNELKNKNLLLVASLPVRRKDIVASKYIGALLYGILGSFVTVILHMVLSLMQVQSDSASWPLTASIVISLVMSFVMSAVYLPVFYALSEKGFQIVNFVAILIFSFTFPLMAGLSKLFGYQKLPGLLARLFEFPGYLLLVGIVLLLILASYSISLRIFEKKDIS